MIPKPPLSLLPLLLLLSACAAPDGTLPSVEVHSALPDPLPARLSVTVKAADDSGIASVSLYARAPGSPNQGQLLGTTAEMSGEGLYTLSVSTTALPDQASLELYATATDGSGEVGASAPVAVRTDHPAAPALTYLVAYTLPQSFTLSLEGGPLAAPLALTAVPVEGGVRFTLPPTLLAGQPTLYLRWEEPDEMARMCSSGALSSTRPRVRPEYT